MYDVRAIANWFLDRADQDGAEMTAMKLQKLAYVSHGWSLAYDTPLVHDAVEAWQWGPVFRSLYREFRDFGSEPITNRATAFDGGTLEDRELSIHDYGPPLNPEPAATGKFLEGVWDRYSGYTAAQLSDITHRPGTPWRMVVDKMGGKIQPFTVIPNDLIAEHYKKLLDERSANRRR
jgi:uncharacterized phage-associated protein